jgi:hypothetical protein
MTATLVGGARRFYKTLRMARIIVDEPSAFQTEHKPPNIETRRTLGRAMMAQAVEWPTFIKGFSWHLNIPRTAATEALRAL